MIRLKEIASECGVNVSTVSRALKDDPRVKAETRTKIHAMASHMGYTPNWAAQSLKGGKTNTIWFLIADLFNPLTAQLATHCSHELAQAGFDLSVILYHNNQDRYAHLLRRLHFGITDGTLIVGSHNFNSFKKRVELINDLQDRSFPAIFLDRFEKETNLPIVTTHHFEAISTLLKNLLGESPDLVINLFDPGKNMVEFARRQALSVLMKEKSQPHQSLTDNQTDQILPGKKIVVLASSEIRVKAFLKQRSSELANRKLIIGVFDHWLGPTTPFLKVFVCQQDFKQMAYQACSLLISRIQNPTFEIPTKTHIPYKAMLQVS